MFITMSMISIIIAKPLFYKFAHWSVADVTIAVIIIRYFIIFTSLIFIVLGQVASKRHISI